LFGPARCHRFSSRALPRGTYPFIAASPRDMPNLHGLPTGHAHSPQPPHGTCPSFTASPAGHAHSWLPGLDILPLCPSARTTTGHVPRGIPPALSMSPGQPQCSEHRGRALCPMAPPVRPRSPVRCLQPSAPVVPCSTSAAGDKVISCPTGRITSPFRPLGSGPTPESCHCGGIACALRPVLSRQPCSPPACSPKTAAAQLPSGTTPHMTPPFSWHRNLPRSGRCNGSASSMRPRAAVSPRCTRRRMNGTRGSLGSPPRSWRPSRQRSPRPSASSRWKCTSSEPPPEPPATALPGRKPWP